MASHDDQDCVENYEYYCNDAGDNDNYDDADEEEEEEDEEVEDEEEEEKDDDDEEDDDDDDDDDDDGDDDLNDVFCERWLSRQASTNGRPGNVHLGPGCTAAYRKIVH